MNRNAMVKGKGALRMPSRSTSDMSWSMLWVLPCALVLGACSGDEECPAFEYAPPPAVVKLKDAQGKKVCELKSVTVVNTVYPDEATVPPPNKRKKGFDSTLVAAQYADPCELRIAGWYDRDSHLPVEAQVTAAAEDEAYEPFVLKFEIEHNACGNPVAVEQSVRLEVDPTPPGRE